MRIFRSEAKQSGSNAVRVSVRSLTAVGALAICAVAAGCSNNSADPSVTASGTGGPLIRNVCQSVNSGILALSYFSIGQPPPSKEQLDQAADAIAQQGATAPADAQKTINSLVTDLRQLANTPPANRASSPAGQDFANAYKLFADYCNYNGVPLPTATPNPSVTTGQ